MHARETDKSRVHCMTISTMLFPLERERESANCLGQDERLLTRAGTEESRRREQSLAAVAGESVRVSA